MLHQPLGLSSVPDWKLTMAFDFKGWNKALQKVMQSPPRREKDGSPRLLRKLLGKMLSEYGFLHILKCLVLEADKRLQERPLSTPEAQKTAMRAVESLAKCIKEIQKLQP